jgi:hypothetical protein
MDYYAVSGASIEEICDAVIAKGYRYTRHFLPHDARAKTLASGGKSIVEQLAAHLGGMSKLAIVPEIGIQDGIQAVRMILPICYFDSRCDEGLEALRQYQREYDEDKKTFRQTPRHDWCSHLMSCGIMRCNIKRNAYEPASSRSRWIQKHHRHRRSHYWPLPVDWFLRQ